MIKLIKYSCCILVILCFSLLLNACNLIDYKVDNYLNNKEQCTLNMNDIRRFRYKETEYTILEDKVSDKGLGKWVGYIHQLVATNEAGGIVASTDIRTRVFENLTDISYTTKNAKYIIPFLNVYTPSDNDLYLIVDINGNYHKAVISDSITNNDTIFDFTHIRESGSRKFEINQQNATQLLYDNKIYQVTNELVSNESLGNLIDTLAEIVTFNANTKEHLSNKKLNSIDWLGTNSNEQRETWFYLDIYEIVNIDANVAVAVKVNGKYYKASKQ